MQFGGEPRAPPWEKDSIDADLAMPPPWRGFDIVGRDKAIQAWRVLAASPAFRSRVYERDNPKRIVGFGASAFVTPAFMEEELRKSAVRTSVEVYCKALTR